jgi:RNA polymerase sigma-70 factor (ECF subfamily)
MSDGTNNLAARAKTGDRAALNALLERHLDTVYRFVSVRMGAGHPELDDIVQETLIGASGSIRTMRGETNAQVAGWLLSIARHKIADHLRARYSHPHESLDGILGEKVPDPERPVDEQVMAHQRAEQLKEAMRLLTPEQEEILVLRFVLGFGISEVAEITRRPAGAVKSMQHRALASLHQRLGPEQVAWN